MIESLRKHRGAIMGAAAWLIVWYHLFMKTPFAFVNRLVGVNGAVGVDVFVFLSGFSMAFSLAKCPSYAEFMKKRLSRVLPVSYVAIIILIVVMLIGGSKIADPRWVFANLIPLSLWFAMPYPAFWYVSAIVVFYAAAPAFYALLKRVKRPEMALGALVFFFTLIFPACFSVHRMDIAIARIPAFVLGIGVGYLYQNGVNRRLWVFFALPAVVSAAWIILRKYTNLLPGGWLDPTAEKWLQLNLCAPLITAVLGGLFELISRARLLWAHRAFEISGRYSLELYLAHCLILNCFQWGFGVKANYVLWISLFGAIPCVFVLNFLAKWLLIAWRKLLGTLMV